MRTPSRLVFGFTGVLVACGGGDETTISITAEHTAVLASRDASGAWHTLTKDSTGKATIDADGPFTILSICEGSADVYALAAGPEDGAEWDVGCPPPTGTGVQVTVRDTSASPGGIVASIGLSGKSLRAGSMVSFEVAPGTYDVALADPTNHRVVIRRGVAINAATTVDLDMSQAVALVARPVTSIPAATYVASSVVTAGKTRIRLNSIAEPGTLAWSLPSSLTVAGDVQRATIGSSDTTRRSRSRTVVLDPAVTTPIAVTLPADLTPGTLSLTPVPTATFTAPGDWERASITAYQDDLEIEPFWYFEQYPGAGAPPGAITFPDPTSAPGWNPAWAIDPNGPWWLEAALSRDTTDGGIETLGTYTYSETPSVRARERRTPDRVRVR